VRTKKLDPQVQREILNFVDNELDRRKTTMLASHCGTANSGFGVTVARLPPSLSIQRAKLVVLVVAVGYPSSVYDD